jgi:hypothetical protein
MKVNIWCNVLPESGVESIQSTIVQEALLSIYASLSIGLYVDSIHLIFIFPTPCYATKASPRLNSTLHARPREFLPNYLHVLAHHGNHEVEQTNGLDEGETQNGVGEELATHAGVAGDGHQEGGEDHADTDTSTTETDGSRAHTNVLGDLDHGGGDLRRVGAAAHDVAGGGIEDGGSLLALHGLEGSAADADACWRGPVSKRCSLNCH